MLLYCFSWYCEQVLLGSSVYQNNSSERWNVHMPSFMWPQFVFSKFIPRLLCQLVLKLLEGLTISVGSGALEYFVFLGAISWPLVWLWLEIENVWLESDCENKTLLKPLKWYFALKQIMADELLMVETSCSIQTKSSFVVLCQMMLCSHRLTVWGW